MFNFLLFYVNSYQVLCVRAGGSAGPMCEYALDDLGSCWPPTAAGQLAQLPCPQILGDIFLVDRTPALTCYTAHHNYRQYDN